MKKSILAISLMSVLCSGVASANLHINGFASIKGGMSTGSDKSLYGYTNEWDFKNESLFAIQVRSDLGDRLSVTAQLMGRGSNDFDARFEWAFLSYELTDNMTFNAGRLRTPFYIYSEFMDVGYAYEWSRVPRSVYGLGFDNIEGVSLYRTDQLGQFDSTLQLVYGSFDGEAGFGPTQLQNLAGLSWQLGQDWYSFRAAYFSAKVTIDTLALNPLLDGLAGAGLGALVREMNFDDDKGTFFGLGLTVDRENLIAVAEYNKVDVSGSLFAKRTNYFVSVGYRINEYTPFISYESVDRKAKSDIYQPFLPVLPSPGLRELVVGTIESQAAKTNTVNLGLRYDFHPSAAFKAQYSSEKNKISDQRNDALVVGVDIVF
ncbi:porin [Alkalimonas sp.]|uniref:porin n=1 Tax=Alkalimonas sp. TaxID=1872453 RepID=UPI00263AAAB5|nr:porin [Alkalimonas sp.]